MEYGSIHVRLLYFDSMGAKCSSVLVETPDLKVLVDPGVAGLQPGFPLSPERKKEHLEEAFNRIRKYGSESDLVVITHYHYDHHPHPDRLEGLKELFRGKDLLVKNPNVWINRSQHKRGKEFLANIYNDFDGDREFKNLLVPSNFRMEETPFTKHPKTAAMWKKAKGKKREVFLAKLKWWGETVKSWIGYKCIPEFIAGDTKVIFGDGSGFRYGGTVLQFPPPFFHGQFLDNIGWVLSFTVKHGSNKFLFTSDLQGPMIEEYKDWIVSVKPDLIVADGPPLYAYGYMMGEDDLNRVAKNMSEILTVKPKELYGITTYVEGCSEKS